MEEQPNITATVPFFMVSDMEAALRFYVDGLGFVLIHSWTPRGTIEWCALKRDNGALMLQELRKDMPHHVLHGGKWGLGVSVCFVCNDALAIYREATGRGLPVAEPFVGNNMWVVAFTDPDGYRIEFESATDVPEETKYTDWSKQNH